MSQDQDPAEDPNWNAGLHFALTKLCHVLGVDPKSVNWDAANESLDGDVEEIIGNILRAKLGDDWSAAVSEDTARLDWLDEVNRKTNERNATVYGWRYDINHNRASLSDHNLPALAIREAIDAARFPERLTEIVQASPTERARRDDFLRSGGRRK